MQKFSRTIGIIGAMDREVESIKDALDEPFTERIAGADFTVGSYMGLRVVSVVSGIGLVNAAYTTQCMVSYPRLKLLGFLSRDRNFSM